MYLASRADSSIGTVPLPTPHAHCLKRMPTCAERSNMHSRRHPRQPHTNALATGLPSRRRRLRCGHCPPPAARRAQVRKESAFPATFRRLPAPQQPAATASTQRPVGPSGAARAEKPWSAHGCRMFSAAMGAEDPWPLHPNYTSHDNLWRRHRPRFGVGRHVCPRGASRLRRRGCPAAPLPPPLPCCPPRGRLYTLYGAPTVCL